MLPSTIECAAQAQRAMSTRHVVVLRGHDGRAASRPRGALCAANKICLGLADADVAVQLAADTLSAGVSTAADARGSCPAAAWAPLCRAAYETTMAVFARAQPKTALTPAQPSARACAAEACPGWVLADRPACSARLTGSLSAGRQPFLGVIGLRTKCLIFCRARTTRHKPRPQKSNG